MNDKLKLLRNVVEELQQEKAEHLAAIQVIDDEVREAGLDPERLFDGPKKREPSVSRRRAVWTEAVTEGEMIGAAAPGGDHPIIVYDDLKIKEDLLRLARKTPFCSRGGWRSKRDLFVRWQKGNHQEPFEDVLAGLRKGRRLTLHGRHPHLFKLA